MRIYCTTCSKEKSEKPGAIRAIDRYESDRINSIYEKAKRDVVEFRILSGKFGLIRPDFFIEWYDRKLEMEVVPILAEQVKKQFIFEKISAVDLFTQNPVEWPEFLPYNTLIEQVCKELNLSLSVHYL